MDNYNSHSENAEMYLVSMAMLAESGIPCPISLPRLAEEMAVQTVSANQMVRKLAEEGLVTYQPYKGVSFTEKGQQAVSLILRNRRLWEVFFVEQLNFTPSEADALACRMEHITQPEVAARLADFLNHPITSPTGRQIPQPEDSSYAPNGVPLTEILPGQQAEILAIHLDAAESAFLRSEKLMPGKQIEVLAQGSSGAVLIRIGDRSLSISANLSGQILTTPLREQPK
ncbi:MAG: DtxR family transcriptional regulator [Anaerolineales bacterium]